MNNALPDSAPGTRRVGTHRAGVAQAPPRPYTLRMQRSINPKVDCVFKALLGAEENRALLIDFLNAMLTETLP
ncbi:MAG: hypothetical protein EOM21_21090, partial [Gammaproteobacteria bacterium]|nr:hypothetical protein [Gammaproteobacteria bacterium]